jgi:hypothetical protein
MPNSGAKWLKIKIPSKNMGKKPTNARIIHSVY